MTRPEERLYVISEKDDKTLMSRRSRLYMASLRVSWQVKGMWSDENLNYLFGAPLTDRTIKSHKENVQKKSNSLISNEWHNRILLSRRSPEKWETDDPDGHQVYGQMMHRLLSFIKTEQDIDGAIERLIAESIMQ